MHGRLKVRTDAEKAAKFRAGINSAFEMRRNCVKDKNALELTEKLVLVNPDVYTLWNYRKEILIEFKSKDVHESTPGGKEDQQGDQTPLKQPSVFDDICQQELTLTQSCLMKQPKSYPVWHHRLWLVTRLMDEPNLNDELDLCKQALNYDSRNFHAWNYRREITKKANVPLQREIEFTRDKISQNFSNFSSWYLRSCLLTQAAVAGEIDMKNLWDEEYSLVENAIFTDPTDQSAWFYHKWLSSINLGCNLKTASLRDELAMQLVICRPSDNLFAVKFNQATDVCPTFKMKLQPSALVYDSQVVMTCNSRSCYKQNVWTAARDLIDLSLAESIEITFSAIDNSLIIPLKKDTTVVAKSRQQSFSVHHSNNRILKEKNIEYLKELQQLEPDSKWINLTLSFFGDTETKLQTLDKLCNLDPLRLNYYRDHKSRLVIESKLNQESVAKSFHINLASNNLTEMFFSPHLVHLRWIDLSGNKITSLTRNFGTFVALETLILDSNEISSIEREFYLPFLKVLSLQNNKITQIEQLDNLIWCEKLTRVCLHGNSIANEINLNDTLKEKCKFLLFDKVDHLNTFSGLDGGELIHIDF